MIYSPLSKQIFIIEDSKGRRTSILEEIKYTIGRQLENQIVLNSTQASRYHATLVRKQQQLEILQSLKCEQMQGYRFSQPLMASEVIKFLSLHRSLISK